MEQMEPAQNSNTTILPRRSSVGLVIITAVTAVLITLAAALLWQKYLTTPSPTETSTQKANSESQVQTSDSVPALKEKLADTEFEAWQLAHQLFISGGYIKDPNDKNKYYYTSYPDDSYTKIEFYVYDLSKDENFQKTNDISVPEVTKLLYGESVTKDTWTKIEGIHDSQLVFYQGSGDDSPGDCFEPLLADYYTFYSLDLSASSVTKQPYKASESLLSQKKAEQEACSKQIE